MIGSGEIQVKASFTDMLFSLTKPTWRRSFSRKSQSWKGELVCYPVAQCVLRTLRKCAYGSMANKAIWKPSCANVVNVVITIKIFK